MFAGELTESEATARVLLAAGGLAVLGLLLALFTIWWWRGTKPEPPALAPLEVMSDRRFSMAGHVERERLIEENRPEGAVPLNGVRVAPEPIDLSIFARDLPNDFGDLREDVPAPLGEALDLAGAHDGDALVDETAIDAPVPDAARLGEAAVEDELHIDPLLQRASSGD